MLKGQSSEEPLLQSFIWVCILAKVPSSLNNIPTDGPLRTILHIGGWSALLHSSWLGGCVRLSLCQRPHDQSSCQVEAEKKYDGHSLRRSTYFPPGKWQWVQLNNNYLDYYAVRDSSYSTFLMKLAIEWVREHIVCPIWKDSLRQVWRLATLLARVFVSSEMWDALHREGPSWANSLLFSLRPFICHHLNTHIKL